MDDVFGIVVSAEEARIENERENFSKIFDWVGNYFKNDTHIVSTDVDGEGLIYAEGGTSSVSGPSWSFNEDLDFNLGLGSIRGAILESGVINHDSPNVFWIPITKTFVEGTVGTASASAEINSDGLSLGAKASALTGTAGLEIDLWNDWEFSFNVNGDLGSIGAELNVDIENGFRVKVGLSAVVGGGLEFGWRKKSDEE